MVNNMCDRLKKGPNDLEQIIENLKKENKNLKRKIKAKDTKYFGRHSNDTNK